MTDSESIDTANENNKDLNKELDDTVSDINDGLVTNEGKLVALEKVSMCCSTLTKEDWKLLSDDRWKDIKNVKTTTGAIDLFKKWPPYKNSPNYVRIWKNALYLYIIQ